MKILSKKIKWEHDRNINTNFIDDTSFHIENIFHLMFHLISKKSTFKGIENIGSDE